ncbi:homocysteine S-methyltransferase 1 [Esox lucius]|uniref:Hcy-binding domain-containing protein n=1 Tax=Esox lucius TaxID=8010 RepID=A0A3P8XW38_ESOLU|nr:homocysteine S-methyltransferase 1 [Esox lucius]
MDKIDSVKPFVDVGLGPLILDGGLATELESAGFKLQGDPLWSARLLHTNPQAVKDAHYRFLCAGADVITTATYQASIEGFVRHLDMTPEQANQLMVTGVTLAREAVKHFTTDHPPSDRREPLVAGSIGPYGAFLHNGSEYTGAYAQDMSTEELKAWHRPQVHCLATAGVNLIAMETIPSVKEAEALLELLREFPDSKAWLSFSCKDGQCISDGSRFSEAVQLASRSSQLVAVGVNCCPPALVQPLLDSAQSQRRAGLSWVIYPNSGEDWDTHSGWIEPESGVPSFAELSHQWMEQGAALIGGCCRISPAHIAELRTHIHGILQGCGASQQRC